MPSVRISSFVATIAVAGTLAVIASAQEQKAPSSGIFVEAAGTQAEVRLPSTRFDTKESGIGKSMATMGLSKPQMHGTLTGAKAYTRVAADVTFMVKLNPQSTVDPQNMSPTDMMGMMGMMGSGDGSIPPMAKGPQDFALVKLTVADDNRDANFGTPGSSRPKDAVDVAIDNLGPQGFRVKPKHPLAPGEYAFYVRTGNAPMGPAWDFGVDQK